MCQDKCRLESQNENNENVMCTGQYVDCDGFGGYDPRDPCKQTCIQKRDKGDRMPADTVRSELALDTTYII